MNYFALRASCLALFFQLLICAIDILMGVSINLCGVLTVAAAVICISKLLCSTSVSFSVVCIISAIVSFNVNTSVMTLFLCLTKIRKMMEMKIRVNKKSGEI